MLDLSEAELVEAILVRILDEGKRVPEAKRRLGANLPERGLWPWSVRGGGRREGNRGRQIGCAERGSNVGACLIIPCAIVLCCRRGVIQRCAAPSSPCVSCAHAGLLWFLC